MWCHPCPSFWNSIGAAACWVWCQSPRAHAQSTSYVRLASNNLARSVSDCTSALYWWPALDKMNRGFARGWFNFVPGRQRKGFLIGNSACRSSTIRNLLVFSRNGLRFSGQQLLQCIFVLVKINSKYRQRLKLAAFVTVIVSLEPKKLTTVR